MQVLVIVRVDVDEGLAVGEELGVDVGLSVGVFVVVEEAVSLGAEVPVDVGLEVVVNVKVLVIPGGLGLLGEAGEELLPQPA